MVPFNTDKEIHLWQITATQSLNLANVQALLLSSDLKLKKNRNIANSVSLNIILIHTVVEKIDFNKTLYVRKTFNSIAGIKNSSHNFTAPWYFEDFIAFIYKVNDYDFPCAAYVNGKFIEFKNISDEDRDIYRSYSGSYVEEVCPLWVREGKFKF